MTAWLQGEKTAGGAEVILITGAGLEEAVREALTWPLVALDVETAQLTPAQYDENGKLLGERIDFHQLALRAVQFGNEDVVYVVDCALCTDLEPLRPLLEGGPRKISHNQNFEYKVLRLAGFEIADMACTMQAEKLLYLGLNPEYNLAAVVRRYLGREMAKDVRNTFVEERQVQPLRPEQVAYAADDVDCLLPIYREQLRKLEAADLTRVAEFEWRVQRAFARIELRGITLDTAMWLELLEQAKKEHATVHEALFNVFRPAVVKRWEHLLEEQVDTREQDEATIAQAEAAGDAWAGEPVEKIRQRLAIADKWLKKKRNKAGELEVRKTAYWDFDKVLTSHVQLREAFLQLGLKLKDTNKKTLLRERRELMEMKERGERYPEDALVGLDRMMQFRKVDKKVKSYGEGWVTAISAKTGRLHAEYDTLKDTARTGCREPNIQQVPKRNEGKVYRRCFLPGEGNLFVIADYSQIELRVAAEMSGDPNMIKAFQSGMDLHLFTAARMFGRDAAEITKDQRTAAKSINFGILFGIGPAALAEGITNDTGVFCSVETARRFLQMYGKTYPRLMDFLKRLGESARHEMETYTALGHRRRFVQPRRPSRADYQTQEDYDDAVDEYRGALSGIEREGKNTPIQGTAACIAKQAILDLERVLGEYGAGIVAFVHDEIVVECPDLMADEVARVLKGTMEAAGRRFMKAVPCVAEVECGLNWLGEGFEEAA